MMLVFAVAKFYRNANVTIDELSTTNKLIEEAVEAKREEREREIIHAQRTSYKTGE